MCRSSPQAASALSIISSKASATAAPRAVLAASIFHFGEFSIAEAKSYMAKHGVAIRLDGIAAAADAVA